MLNLGTCDAYNIIEWNGAHDPLLICNLQSNINLQLLPRRSSSQRIFTQKSSSCVRTAEKKKNIQYVDVSGDGKQQDALENCHIHLLIHRLCHSSRVKTETSH